MNVLLIIFFLLIFLFFGIPILLRFLFLKRVKKFYDSMQQEQNDQPKQNEEVSVEQKQDNSQAQQTSFEELN